MKKLIAIIFVSLLVLAGCGSSGNFEAQTNWEVQDFNYVNQHNKKVSLESMKGTVWLATFVFTNCTSVCPPMTYNMSDIQKMLVDKGIKDYKIVAFSIDPEIDTPQKLQEYLKNYDVADESKWQLLTGYKQDAIVKFAEKSFKALVINDPKSDQVIHGTLFYLVDQNGVVVKNYSGVSDVPKEEIVMDMENLIEDGK
ncbi:SCO family protein [Psychrobacillus sp. L3]|uniref:SCO family protein n=1 Tax=Psychrobacillus sp. L3 TaxID=3236891 RepID=UPI0036F38319